MRKKVLPVLWFLAYCVLMLWLLFDRERSLIEMDYWLQVQENMNLIPFRTIRLFWDALEMERYRHLAIVNLAGNVLLFIPLGYFLPLLWKGLRKWWRTWIAVILIVLAVELTQLFTLRGSFDVDDLILNLAGAAVGYMIYRCLNPAKKKK